MQEKTERDYLLNDQYKNASNLQARIQLHQRFGTNPKGLHEWVFDYLLKLPEQSARRVLELGTGSGMLWRSNIQRIPQDWQITLSDFSPGMLAEARNHLGHLPNLTFEQIDIQNIAYPPANFDLIIANHMLYHVPDRNKAIAEVRRVLKPQGYFFAATNSQYNLHEMDMLIKQVMPEYQTFRMYFNLENGAEQLAQQFSHIDVYHLDNELVVTETEPLIAYILSLPIKTAMTEERLQRLRAIIEQCIASEGVVRIKIRAGIFEAYD